MLSFPEQGNMDSIGRIVLHKGFLSEILIRVLLGSTHTVSLAEASLFCVIVMSLTAFDVTKAVVNGVEITPVHLNKNGIIRYYVALDILFHDIRS